MSIVLVSSTPIYDLLTSTVKCCPYKRPALFMHSICPKRKRKRKQKPNQMHISQTHPDRPIPPPTPTRQQLKDQYLVQEAVATNLAGQDLAFRKASEKAEASLQNAKTVTQALVAIRDSHASLSQQISRLQAKRFRGRLFPQSTNAAMRRLRDDLSVVTESLLEAKTDKNRADAAARSDVQSRETLRKDADMLQQAESNRRHLLDMLYDGKHVGSTEENSIEGQRDRLANVAGHAKRIYLQQKNVYKLLQAALSHLESAKTLLHDAQLSNTVDIFAGGSIGAVAGLSSQFNLRSAGNHAKSAEADIRRAAASNPELPIAHNIRVQNSLGLGFADIFLDNIFTDIAIRAVIEKSVKSVDKGLAAVKESMKAQKKHVESIRGNLKDYSTELHRTSEDLVRVRADLVHGRHSWL